MSLNTIDPRPVLPRLSAVRSALTPYAEPALRITTGLFLVPHGAQKLFGWFGGYGPVATGQFFGEQLGLEPGILFALVAGIIEVFGGLALALGALTRPVALAVAGLLLVAAFHVHLSSGFFWTSGGVEYPLLWAVIAVFFAIRGGGDYAIDRLIQRTRH